MSGFMDAFLSREPRRLDVGPPDRLEERLKILQDLHGCLAERLEALAWVIGILSRTVEKARAQDALRAEDTATSLTSPCTL